MQKITEPRVQLRAPACFVEKIRASAKAMGMKMTTYLEGADVVYLADGVGVKP